MEKDCLQCGKEYEAKRSSSKFCSPKCRVYSHRVSVTPEEVSVTNTPLSVTEEVSVTTKQPEQKEKKIPLFCPKHKGANARYCGCY